MKKTIIIAILLVSLILTACGGSSGGIGSQRDYYVGTAGVEAKFQTGSPPSRLYYYESSPDDNIFDIFVDIHNQGSSFTKGGVYLSGYDPSMIKITGIDIQKTSGNWNNCGVSLGFNQNLFAGGNLEDYFGEGGNFWKGVSGAIDCVDSGVSGTYYDDTNWETSIRDIGELTKTPWLEGVGLDITRNGDGASFGLKIGDDFDIKYLNHGTGLLVIMSGMSFSWYNGREYLLRPNTLDYPGGEMTTEAFEVKVENWPEGLDKLDKVPFLLTNCYLYTTFANEMVCIDPAPFEDRPKVCRSTTITRTDGQGAPVAITKIEPEPTKNKVIFDIEIKNMGRGQIFDMGQMNLCGPYGPGTLTRKELNKVYILDARIGEQQLQCTPDRMTPIELVNGIRNIRCIYNIDYQSVKTAYETPLVIELGYGYQETSQANVQIKRV